MTGLDTLLQLTRIVCTSELRISLTSRIKFAKSKTITNTIGFDSSVQGGNNSSYAAQIRTLTSLSISSLRALIDTIHNNIELPIRIIGGYIYLFADSWGQHEWEKVVQQK